MTLMGNAAQSSSKLDTGPKRPPTIKAASPETSTKDKPVTDKPMWECKESGGKKIPYLRDGVTERKNCFHCIKKEKSDKTG